MSDVTNYDRDARERQLVEERDAAYRKGWQEGQEAMRKRIAIRINKAIQDRSDGRRVGVDARLASVPGGFTWCAPGPVRWSDFNPVEIARQTDVVRLPRRINRKA